MVEQIKRSRQTLKSDRAAPRFLDALYADAERLAKKALTHVRAGANAQAKAAFYAATVYHELAEHSLREIRALREKIGDQLEA